MSMDIRELYQEIIIDHNKQPRYHYELPHSTHYAHGFNPLCGDKLTVYLNVVDKVVQEISFVGCGCAISQASASLMTECLKGKPLDAVEALFHQMIAMIVAEGSTEGLPTKLMVLSGVKAYPARVKCATLAWQTLHAALHKDTDTVSTE